MSHFCETCAQRFEFPAITTESRKEEEILCEFCRFHAAETLYKGKSSCFSCKKLEKNLKETAISPAIPQEKPKIASPGHKHNKTSFSAFAHKISATMRNSQENSVESPRKPPKSPAKAGKKHAISSNIATFSPKHVKSPSSLTKTGAFPENFEEELRRRGIKDLKIHDFLTKILTTGLNSLKSQEIYSWEKDGKNGAAFHKSCDGHAPLLFLVVLHSGFMLGGYIYSPLDENKRISKDKLAGLFSFFGEKAYFYEINEQEVKYESAGFSFGIPQNLSVNLDFLDESRCAQELKFKSPLGAEITFRIGANFVWSLMVKQISAYKLS